jgi:hypothetical protein
LRKPIALLLFVSIRFQVLFHSGYPGSFHLSLAVLFHYRSPKVFSLRDWTPLCPAGLACPAVLKLSTGTFRFSGTGLSPSPVGLPSAFPLNGLFPLGPCSDPRQRLLPQLRNACTLTRNWFGLFPFRSPLLGKYFLFLRVLGCFGSSRAPRLPIDSVNTPRDFHGWVPPFGYLRIFAR